MTPRTPRRHHRHEGDSLPSQKFRIGYQKVTLDVDLAEQTIHGETEITVLPQEASLKEVKLDCRGMQINSVIVNQRWAQFSYGDFGQNNEYMNETDNPVLSDYKYDQYMDTYSRNASILQHHLYRGKYYPLFSDQNKTEHPSASYPEPSSELVIRIPDSIKLRVQSANERQTFPSSAGTSRSVNGTPIATGSLLGSDKVYTPLNIKIIYTVKNSRNGIQFHGGRNTTIPKTRWFCYTYNNDLNCSASSWVPCVDSFLEKPAWDINIVVPKTIADIGETKIIGTKEAERALRKIQLEEMDEDDASSTTPAQAGIGEGREADNGDADEEDEADDNVKTVDESTPIVVAVPDLVSSKESPHHVDVGKKVVNFQFYNPVCAHHLGFAVGPFEKAPLLDLKTGSDKLVPSTAFLNALDEANDEALELSVEANSNKVPTMFYYLPGRNSEVMNTTIFLYKALNFYSKEFSSFPFTSYTLIFLEDFPCDTCTFAGMTIASDRLLYGPDLIEPIFSTTETLASALAEQYSGVNVLPKTLNDIWCTVGLAEFMSLQFLKKLFGLNQYKYMIKMRSDLLCKLDIGKRPLANQHFRFPLNIKDDLEFMRIKAPLVLYILNQRMIKTDKSFGLSRVIPKIFLQAMSNDLVNGNCLSTSHFQHVCEKVAHHKLDEFFNNWVYNGGVPVFHITQKFNKKRMFIEMSIRQVQRSVKSLDDTEESSLDGQALTDFEHRHFVDKAGDSITKETEFEAQNVFIGPVTIRIHEADGTPYEHILYIRDSYTKLDIQYNTKYRRARRKKEGALDEADERESKKTKEEEENESSLGDILMTAADAENWGLKEDDTIAEENSLADPQAYAFEWLRFDADGEWLCEKHINETDQMEESKLRQDRDVEAQLEGVFHFGYSLRPKFHYANVLLRTLLDKRYYFGVRTEAAKALGKISKEENDHIGMRYLLKAFKHLFCYNGEIQPSYDQFDPKEYLPLPNDFSNFSDLFIMKAIVESLSKIRNNDGDSPIELKRILLGIFKYNDNMDNEFDDCFYVCDMLSSLSNLISNANRVIPDHRISVLDASEASADPGDQFSREAMMEMNRTVKMDEWSPSYHDCIETTVFREKIRLARCGLISLTFQELVRASSFASKTEIRLLAFEGLLLLGGLKNSSILELFFTALKIDPSAYIRYQLVRLFSRAVGVAALDGTPSNLDDDEFFDVVETHDGRVDDGRAGDGTIGNTMVIVEENSSSDVMRSRRDEISRKTVRGAIEILRRDYGIGRGLREQLWNAMHSCMLSTAARREILDVSAILYPAINSFVLTVDLPKDKKVVARIEKKDIGSVTGKLIVGLKREGRLMIQIPTLKLKAAPPPTKLLRLRSPSKEKSRVPATPASKTVQSAAVAAATVPAVVAPKSRTKSQEVKSKVTVKKEPPKIKETRKRTVSVVKSGHAFIVTLKFKRGAVLPGAPKKARCSIIRTSAILPIRYVKIRLIEKEIWLSDAENFGKKGLRTGSRRGVRNNKIVTLKVSSRNLARLRES
ncbi:DEKNAAC105032 [Brettanomyces naardenensis]|uniref:Transcription initiation factor TFIID subunit 2 n=1 Tax=Brettanomyces naardenensis TaxID=13370 RepID=A0A448YS63_BRENA|nr:DEKNAAC105032 [Brettanomyces naardenensis]